MRNKNAIKGQINGLSDWGLSLTEASRDAERQVCSLLSMFCSSEVRAILCTFLTSQVCLRNHGSQNKGVSLNI